MKKQKGAALIVVLSLLTMSLMLGLSGMQSSLVDERLSGNYRSSALAMMAAETGASEAWSGTLAVVVNNTSESTFESALDSEVSLGDLHAVTGNGAHPNVYFRIEMLEGVGLDIPLRATGEVFSDNARTDLVASREIEILARLNGLGAGNLSPLNIAATLDNYEGMSSQAGVEGEEEVDGTRNPAISAASKEEAQKIVDDIVGNNGESKYVFIEDDDGSGDGTFYAAAAVDQDGDYTGNYASCNSGQNRLCNYKGGISTKPKDHILSDANLFHDFISAIFSDAYNSTSSDSLSGSMSGFNIISEGDHFDSSGEYRPARYVEGEEMPDGTMCLSEVCQPSRHEFTGGGSSAGDGVLIIDGDVQFNGNPEFQGLIIVLGDYTVKGGGGGDLEGSIIAAPYSCRNGDCFFDEMNVDLRGGGGNDYLHVLEYLDAAWELLGTISPDAARLWLEGNNPEGNFSYVARGWREITISQ